MKHPDNVSGVGMRRGVVVVPVLPVTSAGLTVLGVVTVFPKAEVAHVPADSVADETHHLSTLGGVGYVGSHGVIVLHSLRYVSRYSVRYP